MKTIKEFLSIFIIILTCEGILFSGFTPDAFADGSSQNNCLSVVPIVTVSGTSVICPNTPQQRTTNVSGTQYLSYPTGCGTSQSGSVVTPSTPPNYAGGNGESQGTQSGGGTLPSTGSGTVIAEQTCIVPPCGGGSPGGNNGGGGGGGGGGGCGCEGNGLGSGPSETSNCSGSKVAYTSGTYAFSVTDLRIPTYSLDLNLERTYRSNRVVYDNSSNTWKFDIPQDGPLGYGWMSNYFVKIENDSFIDSQGRYYHFQRGSDGNYLTDMKDGFTLTTTPSGYTLKCVIGWSIVFNSNGQPTALNDRMGHSSYLTYTNGQLTSVSDVKGREVLTFSYDANGHIISATDIAGRTVQYGYDASGNLTSVTDALGNKTTYTYNSYHGLTSKTDQLGNTYNIQYSAVNADKGIVQSVQDPAGNIQTYQYDFANRVFYITGFDGTQHKSTVNQDGYIASWEEEQSGGNILQSQKDFLPDGIVKITDAAGNVTTEQWDESGNVLDRIDGEGNEWKFTYNSNNQMLTRTDPLGVVDEWDYDANGNVTKETRAAGTPDETVTTYTYDDMGKLTSVTRAGATTKYTYNDSGERTSVTDPLGNVTDMEYNVAGDMTAQTDPFGNRTEMTYDAADNLLTRKDALGSVTKYQYDADGNMTSMTDAKGNVTKYEHDFKGRVTKVINALNQGITIAYDAKGNMVKMTELGQLNADGGDANPSDNLVTTMTYNSQGQRTSVTDAAGNTTKYQYDYTNASCGCSATSASTPSKITDPLGNATVNAFDKDNRVVTSTDAMGNVSVIGYDADGRVAAKTDANANTTTYAYDNLGRIVSQTDAMGGVTNFTYDAQGNLATVTDAMGNTTKYEYDLAGHKIKETRPMGQYATFTYDANGNLKTKTDAKGQVTTYNYDKMNRLVGVSYADGKAESFTYDALGEMTGYAGDDTGTLTYDALGRKTGEIVNYGAFSKSYSYTYDAHGDKASFTGPDGVTYSYGYSSIKQPMSITWPGGSILYSYQWNRLLSQNLPNGVNTDYEYNADGWPTEINAKRQDGSTVMDYQYTFDNVGNITGRNTEAGSYAYSYDDIYRLTGATRPSLPSESFGYDKVGNRLTSVDASNWTYNQNNALIGYDGVNYMYDPNGNTTSKNNNGLITSYLYNAKDRLAQANLPNGHIANYLYDPFGRRISKTVDGNATYFMYSDEGLVAEMDGSGNVQKAYGWKPGGTWGTNPVLMTVNGQTYYYHNDHLGTPQKMTDSTGAIVWSAVYMSFGEATVDSTSTITNNLRFPGQYYDAETGLCQNWQRDYLQELGRYIEADPIGQKGGINIYEFTGNSPMNRIDPFGLSWFGWTHKVYDWFTDCDKCKKNVERILKAAQECRNEQAKDPVQFLLNYGGGEADSAQYNCVNKKDPKGVQLVLKYCGLKILLEAIK